MRPGDPLDGVSLISQVWVNKKGTTRLRCLLLANVFVDCESFSLLLVKHVSHQALCASFACMLGGGLGTLLGLLPVLVSQDSVTSHGVLFGAGDKIVASRGGKFVTSCCTTIQLPDDKVRHRSYEISWTRLKLLEGIVMC